MNRLIPGQLQFPLARKSYGPKKQKSRNLVSGNQFFDEVRFVPHQSQF